MIRSNATYWLGRGVAAGCRQTRLEKHVDGPLMRRAEAMMAVGLAAVAAWFALILASPWAAAGAAVAAAVVVLMLESRRRRAQRNQQAADDGGAPVGRESALEQRHRGSSAADDGPLMRAEDNGAR